MLSRKNGGEDSKKDVIFSFFVPHFLLDCLFSLTKEKRQNDKNVLFGHLVKEVKKEFRKY